MTRHIRGRKIWFCALVGVLALVPAPLGAASSYSIAILPDTQNYSDFPAYNHQFVAQTQWVVDNRAAENIVFVSHEGDLVQHGYLPSEWDVADAAMDLLDAAGDLPYSAAIGNHDYDALDSVTKDAATAYRSHFGPARYAGSSWYGGSAPNETNHWQTFEGGGRTFLHLALEWRPDAAAMAWAQDVIDAHHGMPTIITTHEHLNHEDTWDTSGPVYHVVTGQALFDTLISPNDQVFMTMCGHWFGEGMLVSANQAGNDVFELLANYQLRPNGGDGWLRLITFEPDENEIEVYTYSPTLDQYETDADSRFTISMNFDERFGPGPVPEPASAGVLLLGMAALVCRRRRNAQAHPSRFGGQA